jgi:3-oxoacyl-(acyl-carrier-protein) synthase
MDARLSASPRNPVAVTGLGHALEDPCDPSPFLKSRKTRKFMSRQDDLAVVAAGRALECAALPGSLPGARIGLYLAVGYIAFEDHDVDALADGSIEDGAFSMRKFSTVGFGAINPLLTFRCLSNMPAFHVSVNFGIEGPYFVTYPGGGQFYLALEQALIALDTGIVDAAVVAGVAYQKNFLVRHHFERVGSNATRELGDGAGCLVLEREGGAAARRAPVRARLLRWELGYRPHSPFEDDGVPSESSGGKPPEADFGPASLPVALSLSAANGTFCHEIETRDGLRASSAWERS